MGTLYVVATPIGNLNDFSPRGIEILKTCDLILVEDTRQTIKLLNFFNIKNKMVSYHKFNEVKRTDEIIGMLKDDKNIALVSDAGTPCISDPGYILVREAKRNKINVISVPGCSAIIAALSSGGVDTSSFSFYGFVPTESKLKKELFEKIKTSSVKTKVLYESPKRILKLMENIKNELPGCVVSVLSEITKVHEKSFYGKIEDVYDEMSNYNSVDKGEYVVLIENDIKEKNDDNTISLEAMIIDEMIKNDCSIKDAVNIINKKNNKISKKDIYNASLNIKNILN